MTFGRHLAPPYWGLKRNVLVYDGPSQLNGARIFVIASAQNGNRKIGRMVQLWVMPALSPIRAVKTGADDAVCGDCKHRGVLGQQRTCYVEYFRSVENIWQAHPRAARLTPAQFAPQVAGKQLRVAAYGDPVAAPMALWQPLLDVAAGWTSYTHQWQSPLAQGYRHWCMASVETAAEQDRARALGWRTFRVRPVGGALQAAEVLCPHEADPRVQCDSCALCRGASRPAKDIVVTVHGHAGRKHFPLLLERRA